MNIWRVAASSIVLCLGVLTLSAASAETDEEFYRGKTMRVIVGFPAGGGFHTYGQVLAAHMPRFLPGNPTMIVQDMPGAVTAKAAQYIYAAAPQDGTVLGLLHQGIVANQVLDIQGGAFDVTKFNWIGRMGTRLSVGLVWHTAGIRTLDDAKKKDVILGATSPSATSVMIPAALNRLAGTRFKIVQGYTGSGEMYLAIERGETQGLGIAGWLDLTGPRADWVKDGKVFVVYQIALKRHAEMPDIPTIADVAKNADDRKIMELLASTEDMGRSFVSGPDIPKGRIAILRTAFAKMMADKEFLEDAKAKQLDIDFMHGDELQKVVESVGAFPAELAVRAKEIVKP